MFYLLMKQGGGCDYTIECGTRCVQLAVHNMADALDAAKDELDGYGCLDPDTELEECEILEVTSATPVDFRTLIEERSKARLEKKRKKHAEEEQAEYKRLKEKYS